MQIRDANSRIMPIDLNPQCNIKSGFFPWLMERVGLFVKDPTIPCKPNAP